MSSLSDAERLLIQLVSTIISLYHIKNGNLGSKGHVCSFPQDISSICYSLPRFPEETDLLRVIKFMKENDQIVSKSFVVRRIFVLRALHWLKKYHAHYKFIKIDERKLDWLGEEGEKNIMDHLNRDIISSTKSDVDESGATPINTNIDETEESESSFGLIVTEPSTAFNEDDRKIAAQLKEASKKGGIKTSIVWPSISPEPVSEYTDHVFTKAYPWLFPGGVGDFMDSRSMKVSCQDWAKIMFYYFDGRFQKDKSFSFFLLNYMMRRKNQDQ